MPLGSGAVKRCAVLFDVVFRATVNKILELLAINSTKLEALSPRAQVNSLHHLAMELRAALRSSRIDRDIALCAYHTAADVVAYGPHRDRPVKRVRPDH